MSSKNFFDCDLLVCQLSMQIIFIKFKDCMSCQMHRQNKENFTLEIQAMAMPYKLGRRKKYIQKLKPRELIL